MGTLWFLRVASLPAYNVQFVLFKSVTWEGYLPTDNLQSHCLPPLASSTIIVWLLLAYLVLSRIWHIYIEGVQFCPEIVQQHSVLNHQNDTTSVKVCSLNHFAWYIYIYVWCAVAPESVGHLFQSTYTWGRSRCLQFYPGWASTS